MTDFNLISSKKNRIKLGWLNKKITLQQTGFNDSNNININSSNFSFTDIKNLFAHIETISIQFQLNNISLNTSATHNFYIRFDPSISITSENFILRNNIRYRILGVENFQNENLFLKISTKQTGNELQNPAKR